VQDRGAWIKHQGDGIIVYFMMGHSAKEFEDVRQTQMILNAIQWTP
jgi:type 1 glutamine amidotransferase